MFRGRSPRYALKGLKHQSNTGRIGLASPATTMNTMPMCNDMTRRDVLENWRLGNIRQVSADDIADGRTYSGLRKLTGKARS
jgi:hypothetical protein